MANVGSILGEFVTDDVPGKISLADAVARVHAEPVPYALLFERGDLAVELFIPRGRDTQPLHVQDELYLIQSGAAILDRNGERVACGAGDVLYVPAGMTHRFESYSSDFRTWVIYVRAHAEA
jgi:mannose-6-phosphate isomerase-like protein (cupin superfamily)